MAAMLKRLDAMEGNRAVQAQVHGGADYVHLGPTPAEAAAASAGGQRRQQQQQQAAKNVQLKAAAAAGTAAAPWTEVVNGERGKPRDPRL